jgi:hypothetical protein
MEERGFLIPWLLYVPMWEVAYRWRPVIYVGGLDAEAVGFRAWQRGEGRVAPDEDA